MMPNCVIAASAGSRTGNDTEAKSPIKSAKTKRRGRIAAWSFVLRFRRASCRKRWIPFTARLPDLRATGAILNQARAQDERHQQGLVGGVQHACYNAGLRPGV